MPYNICCFTRITFSHDIKGGMELHTRILSEELVNRGHRVTILTTSLNPMKEQVKNENGVDIHYLPVSEPGRYSKEYFLGSVQRFKILHATNPFDAVWSESAGAIGYVKKIARDFRIPLLTKLQGSLMGAILTLFRSAGSPKKGLINSYRRVPGMLLKFITWHLPLLKNSNIVICPSPQTAKETRIETLTPKSKIYISVNGVDINQFRPDSKMRAEGRKLLNLKNEDFLILNVGRLSSDKGIQVLLHAAATCIDAIPLIKLAIIGKGAERRTLESLTQEMGLSDKVRFLGFIPNDQLPKYYNASELFICPTIRVESFGIVIAEAMACGIPVISSATGGTRYLVKNMLNGILFPPGNKKILSAAIQRIYSDSKLAYHMGQNARRYAVENLSSIRMGKDTEVLIKKLVD